MHRAAFLAAGSAAGLFRSGRSLYLAAGRGERCGTRARLVEEPDWIWAREPPIRYRRNVPTAWPEITLTEGRNRQVRRMTAAVGHPPLRLVHVSIGAWKLGGLRLGEWEIRR
jgi:pseudouridine synthase